MTDKKKNDNKQENKTSKKEEKKLAELEARVEELQRKLTEQEEITKRAQSDYLRLKIDMDGYMQRAEQGKQASRVEAVISIGQKLLPFVTQLQQSATHVPAGLEDENWVKGVQLIAKKALSDIEQLGIQSISANVGDDPDLTLHMPVNMEDTDDDALKGKIIKVVEGGYIYTKDGQQHVISPAKIVVGT